MTTLYIMQGIPGCGKSHVAKLIAQATGAFIASADTFHGLYDHEGFHPELLGSAHANSFRNVARGIRLGRTVILDNTNLIVQEVTPYVIMAHEFGYEVKLVRVPCRPSVAFKRQTHGVPKEVHEKMYRRFKSFKRPDFWPVSIHSAAKIVLDLTGAVLA